MNNNLIEKIKISGNNLHLKVTELLEGLKWEVEISSYYYDDTMRKPREIDIVAKKRVDINSSNRSFFIFLFIECKYFKDEIAFILHKNNKDENKRAIMLNGFYQDENFIMAEFLKNHHYLSREKISKLYNFNGNKIKGEDKDLVFSAFTQAAKSSLFFKHAENKKGIYYPLVVYDGIDGIYEIDDITNLKNINNKIFNKHSIFSFNYWYKWREENQFESQRFCVDFLHFDVLKDFIERTIEKEMAPIILSESTI